MPNLHGNRRQCLVGMAGTLIAAQCSRAAQQPEADPSAECPRCRGSGRVPLAGTKPWVWTEGQSLPKWADILDEQWCPLCRPDAPHSTLVSDLKARFENALKNHQAWEERTGFSLHCVLTRHAALHTQLSLKPARDVGSAFEKLTLHLQTTTNSLALTPSLPSDFEIILLLEKPSWDAFRLVMEKQYSPAQLGESWFAAQRLNAYDHFVTPHLYETKETLRLRPPSCGATFILARRQIQLAANWLAPFWLSEGFAAYGDLVVHGVNRWCTVYTNEKVPVTNWLAETRKLAIADQLLPWQHVMNTELRDWQNEHHFQSLAMVAYLLTDQPTKFLAYVHRLNMGEPPQVALETAYAATSEELQEKFSRWIVARR